MGLKSDRWIREMAQAGMITPFVDHQERDGVISYGLSSYGYDMRVADEYRIFTNLKSVVVDPKAIRPESMVEHKGETCIIPPNSFCLARSVEYFHLPDNVTGLCVGKSTYARCGIVVNITPLEAGWEGHLTLEISNTTPLPAKIYSFEGIAQILFFEGDEPCLVTYAQRHGKYQKQRGITLPRL